MGAVDPAEYYVVDDIDVDGGLRVDEEDENCSDFGGEA